MTNKNQQSVGNDGSDTTGGNGSEAERSRAAEAYQAARERTSAAYSAARERAGSAYETAREGASRATQRTAETVDSNPMVAVVGGLAFGAVAAALLPRTRKEEELLGAAGQRIRQTAQEAARAAQEAGKGKLGELGLSRDAARERVADLVSTTATAAVGAVRGQGQPS
jgi:ElaB/YqjD/DUF883 family membrane-anchored ribosome-binding protein